MFKHDFNFISLLNVRDYKRAINTIRNINNNKYE